MTHTLTVARHPRRGGRAPDRPRFFSQEHVGDKHAARRLMELPPVFDRGVWVWDEIRQDARPRLPFACMHALTCGAPRRSHTSRRFPRSMEHRSNGCPGRAGPARKRRRVNRRGRPVVVVHGEADTSKDRDTIRWGHGKQTTVGVCVTVSSYTNLEDGNIGHRERYFSKMATEVFSLLPLRTKIRTAGSQFSIVLPLSTEHAILAFCFLIR